jgi:FkbH-like protein
MPFGEPDPTPGGVHLAAPAEASQPKPAIAISATFTAEALEPTIAFWLRELKLDFRIRFAPYNQVFQQLLDPAGLLAGNRNGLNVVLVRFEDWARFRERVSIPELEDEVRNLESALRTAAVTAGSPLLVSICPASPDFLADAGRAEFAQRSEESLRSALQNIGTMHVVTAAEIERLYPVPAYYDPHADELGHLPYTPEFFAALGTVIARKLHALGTNPYKVIALDCDDTLWDGVCGEDGPEGVRLDAGRRALQEFMLAEREAGMLLCLCSKNNPEDVYQTFRAHPEMPLELKHFTASRLNWEPKSASLRSLGEELGLGLESFIVVDNSAAECAEVEAACPEVLTACLPASSSEFAAFLNHIWAFDRWRTTEEDRQRAKRYAQEAERSRAAAQAASLGEFLASLRLEVHMAPMMLEQLPRVAQLSQRTSQMNFSTIRRNEREMQNLVDSGYECLVVDVSDRFGSYGLTGVILFRQGEKALVVDSFLLSCRTLGRGVEHRMLARLGEIARERGLGEVEVRFVPAARNRPAGALLASIGAQFEEPSGTGSIFHFPADYLAQVRYTAADQAGEVREERGAKPAPAASAGHLDYARIALKLREPRQIFEAVRQGARRRPAPEPAELPRSGLEKQLAQMWASLLRLPAVGIHENFFELGGHSLLAVQLLSLVRQTFDVDLSLKVVYSGDFTVAELAKAVELREIEQAGAERYGGILKELEGLSDDEVRALLAQEQDGAGGKP